MRDQKMEIYFNDWIKQEEAAESMVPLIGKLYRNYGVVTTIYGRSLVHASPIDILKAHRFSRQILKEELSVFLTFPILQALSQFELAPTRIDIGKLTTRYQHQKAYVDLDDFVRQELAEINTRHKTILYSQDVVLYGFGRIGRMLARILIERSGGGDKWRLRAVVVNRKQPGDLMKRASLLRRDSIHGPFKGTIVIDEQENALVANGNMIRLLYADSPEYVDYTQYAIHNAIVLDNTGVWSDRRGLEKHLKAEGVSKVILTAPGKGDIPNIVYGVNNDDIAEGERIFSAASCTTNAIVPVLKVMHDRFHIENGHIQTCHSYTNDQNLIDNYHTQGRRGRGAPLNMVITETGAADAVAKVLPELAGKLTANAIRVPTPNVSLAILNLTLGQESSVEEVNNYLREISLDSPLQGQIDYINSSEVVSSDFIGSLKTGIVDAPATIVQGKRCVLYIWYDNEFGYSCQVVRILQHIAGLELPGFPR
ncbi:MAG: glyceraldehyde-3-phosphate dehydrogenase [Candidatus Poribacteria bacterium]|nr:glyceraldehyde-3-phosphate dehydrogenase [Candidatus Poribacteria bacterium]